MLKLFVFMNHKAREVLEKHIDAIVNEFSFLNRQKKDVSACPCYSLSSKPCHLTIPLEELNCLFCLCPNYIHPGQETGCKINSPRGKWSPNSDYPSGFVWDCSDCDYPHKNENVRKELRKLWGLDEA